MLAYQLRTRVTLGATGWMVLGAILGATGPATAQPLVLPDVRIIGDAMGSSTEHFSADHHGTASFPTEHVSVGTRWLVPAGQGLHVLRYAANHSVIGESAYLPVGSDYMVGYSVDTMANGDLLIAGECEDVQAGGPMNTFVLRANRQLTTILWAKLLPGGLNLSPSVTARELADGTIVVLHNEWPPPGGDLGPGFGHCTRLTANGALIWSRRYSIPGAPFGQIRLADVRQPPSAADPHLYIAGTWFEFPNSTALLLRIRLADGCTSDGENCAWLYPHPAFENTTLSSLYFDKPAGSSTYTIVAAGAASALDISSVAAPRVLDVPGQGGCQNWDHVWDFPMTPAPTALTIRGGAYATAPRRISVVGTHSQLFNPAREAQCITLDAASLGTLLQADTFGGGVPPYTAFNDLNDSLVMIGSRGSSAGPFATDVFYTGRGLGTCSEVSNPVDLGPGTCLQVCPDCQPDERITDLPLITIAPQSFSQTVCRYVLSAGTPPMRRP